MNRSCGGWTGIESDLSVRLWPRPSQTVERLVATVFARIPEFEDLLQNMLKCTHTHKHKCPQKCNSSVHTASQMLSKTMTYQYTVSNLFHNIKLKGSFQGLMIIDQENWSSKN